jgi:hypothetical protein
MLAVRDEQESTSWNDAGFDEADDNTLTVALAATRSVDDDAFAFPPVRGARGGDGDDGDVNNYGGIGGDDDIALFDADTGAGDAHRPWRQQQQRKQKKKQMKKKTTTGEMTPEQKRRLYDQPQTAEEDGEDIVDGFRIPRRLLKMKQAGVNYVLNQLSGHRPIKDLKRDVALQQRVAEEREKAIAATSGIDLKSLHGLRARRHSLAIAQQQNNDGHSAVPYVREGHVFDYSHSGADADVAFAGSDRQMQEAVFTRQAADYKKHERNLGIVPTTGRVGQLLMVGGGFACVCVCVSVCVSGFFMRAPMRNLGIVPTKRRVGQLLMVGGFTHHASIDEGHACTHGAHTSLQQSDSFLASTSLYLYRPMTHAHTCSSHIISHHIIATIRLILSLHLTLPLQTNDTRAHVQRRRFADAEETAAASRAADRTRYEHEDGRGGGGGGGGGVAQNRNVPNNHSNNNNNGGGGGSGGGGGGGVGGGVRARVVHPTQRDDRAAALAAGKATYAHPTFDMTTGTADWSKRKRSVARFTALVTQLVTQQRADDHIQRLQKLLRTPEWAQHEEFASAQS